jgi:hypothetical protein
MKRIGTLYSTAIVAMVAKELADTRQVVSEGRARDGEAYVQQIHECFTLQRFTRWHNSRTRRRDNLWEETFKSVVVEGGLLSKTMAAYIDLNPVRAGTVVSKHAHGS